MPSISKLGLGTLGGQQQHMTADEIKQQPKLMAIIEKIIEDGESLV